MLTNSTVNNYGARSYRRFKTTISITYDTPPVVAEAFVEGLKQLVAAHPKTRKDFFEIHLNDFDASALSILFYIFFDVPTWSEELRARHEMMIAVLELAQALGVRFAFPTSTIHIEEMPGHTGLSPTYEKNAENIAARLEQFIGNYRARHKEGNKQ